MSAWGVIYTHQPGGGRYPHRFRFSLPAEDAALLAALDRLRRTPMLEPLRQGRDYTWYCLHGIGFRRKRDAVGFLLSNPQAA